jgi:purine-binding chemotaxis protein CheW
MNAQSYFTFSLDHCRYGIDMAYVDEVFTQPKLIPIDKASYDIVGIVNLRGDILPVMDLNLSLGRQPTSYRLTDTLVILRWENLRVGIIVDEVCEIRNLSSDEITTEFPHEQTWSSVERKNIIAGVVKGVEDIVILSNPRDWLWYSEIQHFMSVNDSLKTEVREGDDVDGLNLSDSDSMSAQQPVSLLNATSEQRDVFRKRAENLKLLIQSHAATNLKSLIVVTLGHHFFGIDVEVVREFIDVRKATPIPCCPVHIIGNMNLRGEILTIIDIRGLLNPAITRIDKIKTSKAMVVEVQNIVAGVIVDEISDTMFAIGKQDIIPVSNAKHAVEANEKYLHGITFYNKKAMGILDMSKVFLNSELIIDEVI